MSKEMNATKTILTLVIALIFTVGISCQKAQNPQVKTEQSRQATREKSKAKNIISPVKSSPTTKEDILEWDFEDTPPGEIPKDWKVEATNLRGDLETWKVTEDKSAPAGSHVLTMANPNHRYGETFNLCWKSNVKFLDGEIEVYFKALHGRIDQGGGVIWRAIDKNNYYIARFNPLEDNFRIYYVKNGSRRVLASTKIALQTGKWWKMKIVQRGNHFEGYLNGNKLLEGTDNTFKKAGGIGLWTKSDAETSFDDFKVIRLNQKILAQRTTP